jgi:hypothetical protein
MPQKGEEFSPPKVTCHFTLHRASNLIENALNHSPSGGGGPDFG